MFFLEVFVTILVVLGFLIFGYWAIANLIVTFMFSFQDMVKELREYNLKVIRIFMIIFYFPAFLVRFITACIKLV